MGLGKGEEDGGGRTHRGPTQYGCLFLRRGCRKRWGCEHDFACGNFLFQELLGGPSQGVSLVVNCNIPELRGAALQCGLGAHQHMKGSKKPSKYTA